MMDQFFELKNVFGPGVYALYWYDELVYIGRAKRLFTRIYAHRALLERSRKGPLPNFGPYRKEMVVKFNRVFIRPCKLTEVEELERQLIQELNPKRNIKLKTKPKLAPIELNIGGHMIQVGGPQRPPDTGRIRRI